MRASCVYKVDGVAATALRDALIAAWKGDYPEMTVSQVKVGGKDVTKGDFGEDTITSYLYIQRRRRLRHRVGRRGDRDRGPGRAPRPWRLRRSGGLRLTPRPHRASLRPVPPRRSRRRADASGSAPAAAPDGVRARGDRRSLVAVRPRGVARPSGASAHGPGGAGAARCRAPCPAASPRADGRERPRPTRRRPWRSPSAGCPSRRPRSA